MVIKLSQQLKQSQTLLMTPQLQHAIKLLTIPHLEMTQVINNELAENPVLEENFEAIDNLPSNDNYEEKEISGIQEDYFNQQNILDKKDDFDWAQYVESNGPNTNSSLTSPQSASRNNSSDENFNYENIVSQEKGLTEHLIWQISMENLLPEEYEFAQTIIYNLNESGLLESSFSELLKETSLYHEDAQEILKMIQNLDPIGCAASNIQESLIIQAKAHPDSNHLSLILLEDYFQELQDHNYHELITANGVSKKDLDEAIHFIQNLCPRPGKLISNENNLYVVPDVYVKNISGKWIVSLNEEGVPDLKVSKYYENLLNQLKGKKDKLTEETIHYLQEKLKSAQWLIRSINQRKKTIHKVAETIVEMQPDFFDKGPQHLKPMILKDIALSLGMHESTISRTTVNKYMHTPLGVFELKYFFNAGLGGKSGGVDIASEALKLKIKSLISLEMPEAPLSDQKISELLKKEGVDIARRTIAKYREILGIEPSSKRKKKKK